MRPGSKTLASAIVRAGPRRLHDEVDRTAIRAEVVVAPAVADVAERLVALLLLLAVRAGLDLRAQIGDRRLVDVGDRRDVAMLEHAPHARARQLPAEPVARALL